MPCYDPTSSDLARAEDLTALERKLNNVTAMLCGVCTFMNNQELFQHYLKENPDLAKWWKKYQEFDRKRKK